MLLTIIIAFISIISLLIIHEFGHFVVAKKFGVKVEEFGVGYPPRLFGKKVGETLYSLNLLPFGAFVKIAGEEGEDKSLENYRSFQGKSAWQKILIILGGVVSFWLVAIILLSIVFWLGVPQAISDEENGNLINPKVQILAVAANSPAEKAGIKPGDAIIKIQNPYKAEPSGYRPKSKIQKDIGKVKEVQSLTDEYKGQEIVVTIQRGREVFDVSLVPRLSPPMGEGAMGVALVRTAEKSYPWWLSPVKGITATADLTQGVVVGWGKILGNLIGGKGMPAGLQLMGPIGIGSMIGQAAQIGLNYFLQFIAIISIYLAVFNLLPIPALDGGKLLFITIEKIKGSPVNQKIEQKITAAFFGLLLLLMVFVTIQDIIRLF